MKFADNITVVGLISEKNERAYREELENLSAWCGENNLTLNTKKTKEMIVYYRRPRDKHTPLNIKGCEVEHISNYYLVGVHIGDDLTWQMNKSHLVKKAQKRLYFLWTLKKAQLSPQISQISSNAPLKAS